MTAPEVWAQRFAISCLVGAQLGILYGFLRPLRPRHRTVSDLLFLPGLLAAFLYTGFSQFFKSLGNLNLTSDHSQIFIRMI